MEKGAAAVPGDNVYITDLPEMIDDEMVRTVFGAYGMVMSVKAMPGKTPGQKGAALVRFATVDEATWVVENLSGNIPQGFDSPVNVRFANQRSKGGKGDGGGFGGCGGYGKGAPAAQVNWSDPYGGKGAGKGKGGKGGCDIKTLLDGLFRSGAMPGGQKDEGRCLYVTGFPADTTDFDIYKMFSPFGAICQRGVTAMKNPDGSCRGFGFVDFVEPQGQQAAIMVLDGTLMPDGSTLSVKPKGPSKTGKGAPATLMS